MSLKTKYSAIVLRKKLDAMDSEIENKGLELEDLQSELESLHDKRVRFARRHCPHTKTTSSSGSMGRWPETTCDLCGIEL